MTQAVIQTTVTGMQGRPIATTVPTANQAYTWSGTAWVPTGPFLPLAGGVVTGVVRMQFANSAIIFNDTSTSITAGGLWRVITASGQVLWQSNTATAGDFSTIVTPLTMAASGLVTAAAGFGVSGNASVSGTLTVNGAVGMSSTLNITNTMTAGAVDVGGGSGFSLQIDGSNNRILNWATTSNFIWSASNAQLMLNLGNTLAAIFYVGGNLGISGTLTQGSDATSKTNINPITTGISLIRQLIPKSFAWNSTPNVTQWGFIAQDVQPVVPAAVGSMPPMEEGGTSMLSLDITGIVAAIAMAVKQLDQRCTALESHDGITPPAAQLA